METIKARVMNRIDSEANWLAEDPVILNGEITLTKRGNLIAIRVGDGIKKYSELTDNVVVNADGAFKGIAQNGTDPGTPETPEYWFGETGNYPNFGNLDITGEFGMLSWNGSSWVALNVNIDLSNYVSKDDFNASIVEQEINNINNYSSDDNKVVPMYFDELETLGYSASSKEKKAIINFVNSLVSNGISSKMIGFLPFIGNNDTIGVNLFDPKNRCNVVQILDTMVDVNGLIGGGSRISFPFKLSDVSYNDDGQPNIGAGVLFTNKNAWPSSPSTPWISNNFQIDYWYSDNKSYVNIGGAAVLDAQSVSNSGYYWNVQRNGNQIKVFSNSGIVNSLNSTSLSATNLVETSNDFIRFYNSFPNDYRFRAIWIAKSLSDQEERILFNLLDVLKNNLA